MLKDFYLLIFANHILYILSEVIDVLIVDFLDASFPLKLDNQQLFGGQK